MFIGKRIGTGEMRSRGNAWSKNFLEMWEISSLYKKKNDL